MYNSTLCYIEDPKGNYLMLHRVKKKNDLNHDKWVGVGGKFEDGESPEECVLRETWEELAIPPEAVEVIGEMDFLHIRSNCLLRPVLGRVDGAALADIRPCAAEVAETFLVPLDWLRDHPPAVYIHRQPVSISDFPYEDAGISADYLWRPYYMEVPVYHGLPHPLWGLTARITMDVVAHL